MDDRTTNTPVLDIRATMTLEELRAGIDGALAAYQSDVQLRRALIQAAGAIDTKLGRPRELPSRRDRRSGPR